jgi:hypothetical protein
VGARFFWPSFQFERFDLSQKQGLFGEGTAIHQELTNLMQFSDLTHPAAVASGKGKPVVDDIEQAAIGNTKRISVGKCIPGWTLGSVGRAPAYE